MFCFGRFQHFSIVLTSTAQSTSTAQLTLTFESSISITKINMACALGVSIFIVFNRRIDLNHRIFVFNFQAKSKTNNDPSKPYRSVDNFDNLTTSPFPECHTIDDLFQRAVRLYGPSDCLGTRELLSEESEKQPNGRIFKKVSELSNLSR